MSLQSSLKKGDWVEADHADGGHIIGQATHDMSRIGDASLKLKVDLSSTVEINVNYWDVKIVMANLLPYTD